MNSKTLHIVAFDVPYPADYGGAIDIFYKLQSLHKAGAEIHLHCFEYGRPRQDILATYCKTVKYYRRQTGPSGISVARPYMVSSRNHPELLADLLKTDAPILFEGVHTTFFLDNPALKNRFKAIRIHNVEHDYYRQLAAKKNPFAKNLYFRLEARMLKSYEHSLHNAQAFFALSQADSAFFAGMYPHARHLFIPPFHAEQDVVSQMGSGSYCLYQGNLAHPENIEAANFLLDQVIPHAAMPVTIAGRHPAPGLKERCAKTPNCTLVADPTEAQMDELVAGAHIHLLPTFQRSGVKLKLLKALFRGRHVVANRNMLYGTGLNNVCTMADSGSDFIHAIAALAARPFTAEDIAHRQASLKNYDNDANAALLLNNIP